MSLRFMNLSTKPLNRLASEFPVTGVGRLPRGFGLDSNSVAQLAMCSMSMPAPFSGVLPTVMTAVGGS
jgi:hypothetical protein